MIAIVNEYRQTNRIIDDDNLAFQRLMETIANTYPNQHRKYLFGWSSDHLTMNSIVMHTIQPVPNLIVLNSTTIQYYLFEDGTKTKDGKSFRPSQSSIVQWLDDIIYRPNTVKVSWLFAKLSFLSSYNFYFCAGPWRRRLSSSILSCHL